MSPETQIQDKLLPWILGKASGFMSAAMKHMRYLLVGREGEPGGPQQMKSRSVN